ncbi:MAG: hypothetical protein HW382_1009 [Deltaproteobacteria bacterium]|nr:hypothetical protein [Deltaproteobacteria bacterium]
MTGRELIKILEENGWVLDRVRGSHHIMIKDDKTLSVPLHGSKDLGKGLLNRLLKDGGICCNLAPLRMITSLKSQT